MSELTETGKVKGSKVGTVSSDTRERTRRVVIEYLATHTKYEKRIRRRTVLHVHDENNESRAGDLVEVAPCPPVSKTKAWKLLRIVRKRAGA